MIRSLLRALAITGPWEAVGVLLGIAYVVLIIKRSRAGWIAGGASSAIYVYLSLDARLPMQATLQVYYVVMSFYGWFSWQSAQRKQGGGIVRWPLRWNLLALLAIGLLSLASAAWLARETHAAWPYLDSFTTWVSLLATWMVARMMLENWLYWIAADGITTYLFAAQGYLASSALYLVYTLIAVFGYREWLLKYQQRPA